MVDSSTEAAVDGSDCCRNPEQLRAVCHVVAVVVVVGAAAVDRRLATTKAAAEVGSPVVAGYIAVAAVVVGTAADADSVVDDRLVDALVVRRKRSLIIWSTAGSLE